MAEPDLKRVKEVYTGALEKPPQQRQAYIEEACRGDQQLRDKVERMLAAKEEEADFMTGEGQIAAAETLDVSSTSQTHPESIGHYKIIHPIGEGGMGIVYLAEQTEPVRRRVAIKLVKLGMDTKQVVARFEAERQALAMMDHPNVAQVFEAGATETGRPYFAMEYVPGVPITKFCDTLCLTMPERLEFFMQVCDAIQHAHQKGIIHRDLKPTNVLVMRLNGKPVPKVIDFGVAKATQQRLTEQTLFTEQGLMIGTPAYMSPEQAEMSPLGVDSRTDVYSLGVLLYELLVSMLPFEPAELRRAGYAEIQRIIREVEPPKPSTRFSSLANESGSICDQRRLDTKSMRRLLKGDLDWITMKAIDKDPARRYASASELAADIQRYLTDEPVVASPPGRAYRFRKFARRNRTQVFAAGVVLVVLLGGIAGTSVGLIRARSARDAEAEQRRIADTARGEVQERADELKTLTDFQQSMLGEIDAAQMGRGIIAALREGIRLRMESDGVDPEKVETALGSFDGLVTKFNATNLALRVVDEHVLRRAVQTSERDFAENPILRAALDHMVAQTYGQIGLVERAIPLQEACLRTRRRELGDDHPDTLRSINHMGYLLYGRGKYAEAESYHRQAMEGRRRVLGDDHPDTLVSISAMGFVLQEMGKHTEALSYQREALEGNRRVLGDDHPSTLVAINSMGTLLHTMSEYDEALPYYREALEGRRRVLGDDHPATLDSIHRMGQLLQALGKHEEAVPYHREALDGRRRVLGDDHPHTLYSIDNIGPLLQAMGKHAEALSYHREALGGNRRVLGDDHPSTLTSISNMGYLLQAMGQHAEALPYHREALDGRRRVLGEEHPKTLWSMSGLASVYEKQAHHDEAEGLRREIVEIRKTLLDTKPGDSENQHQLIHAYEKLGAVLEQQGSVADANNCSHELTDYVKSLAQQVEVSAEILNCSAMALLTYVVHDLRDPVTALEFAKRAVESSNEQNHNILDTLALAQQMNGDIEAAIATQTTAVALLGPGPSTLRSELESNLLKHLLEGLRFTRAEPLILEMHEEVVEDSDQSPSQTRASIERLVKFYESWNAAEPGKGYDQIASEWREKPSESTAPEAKEP